MQGITAAASPEHANALDESNALALAIVPSGKPLLLFLMSTSGTSEHLIDFGGTIRNQSKTSQPVFLSRPPQYEAEGVVKLRTSWLALQVRQAMVGQLQQAMVSSRLPVAAAGNLQLFPVRTRILKR